MNPTITYHRLSRLRKAADTVLTGFCKTSWQRISGSGKDEVTLDGNGTFTDLELEPGKDVTLRCSLDLPAEIDGVRIAGDSLIATLFTIYPTTVKWNGMPLFEEDGVPVACGPALFEILPSIQSGDNGQLEFTIHISPNQTTKWVNFRLTTPGLRAKFERLDIAWAQLSLANAMATSNEEFALVEQAAALFPEEGDLDIPDAFSRLPILLEPFAERISKLNVHMIGHSHIDMNWLWTWPDTVEVIRRDFKAVLSLLDDYPELNFSHSQPATYDVFQQEEPELFQKVLAHIQSGRWEPTTMTWLEGDVNMASGEAHARQLLEGVLYTREILKGETSTFHAPDTFGHAGNLPQLAVSAGTKRYYHHRANEGQENQWPAYWWEGDDGTRLLAISTYTYNGEINACDLANAAIRAHKFGHTAGLHFHGIGDHGGGPSRQNLDALRRFQKTPLLPTTFCSRMDSYTDEILKHGAALPVHKGESSTIFEGCYTTHADTKYFNRTGENILTTADTLAALAGQNHTSELTPAWRKILFNQFHDILDGSAIHESYIKNSIDFNEARIAADFVISSALTVLQAGAKLGEIAVTNPLSFERRDVVTIPNKLGQGPVWLQSSSGEITPGQYSEDALVFVARVGGYSTIRYTIVRDLEIDSVPDMQAVDAYSPVGSGGDWIAAVPEGAPYFRIETPLFKLFVRKDCGIIVSLFDKRAGRELVAFGMRRGSDYVDTARPDLALNVLQLVEERPHGMSAWQYQEVEAEKSLIYGAETSVLETGPVRVVLEVRHELRHSKIVQQIIIYNGLPRIDFVTSVDWQELGGEQLGVPNLKATFTASLMDCEAWFETPFAAVRRPANGQESPALRWADMGGDTYGIALLNDSKYGYDILGNRLRLTLLRSGYDPDAISDVGQHQIRYSLLPHCGSWRDSGVVQAAAGYNQPFITRVIQEDIPAKDSGGFQPAVVGSTGVQISCIKQAHRANGRIIRLYESAGRAATIELTGLPSGSKLWETNIIEDIMGDIPSDNGRASLTFRPWQVRTLLVTA